MNESDDRGVEVLWKTCQRKDQKDVIVLPTISLSGGRILIPTLNIALNRG